jgi:hypothetical protein
MACLLFPSSAANVCCYDMPSGVCSLLCLLCLQVVLEGDLVNLGVTSPAAALALGLMYLQTNDAAVAAAFQMPGKPAAASTACGSPALLSTPL